jgi:hypothetical protein
VQDRNVEHGPQDSARILGSAYAATLMAVELRNYKDGNFDHLVRAYRAIAVEEVAFSTDWF